MSEDMQRLLLRVLAVAILLALPLIGWVAVARPLIGVVVERQSEIDLLSERLARLQAAIRRIPTLQKSDATNKQRLDAAGGIWTESSEAAIAATMQDRLRSAVSSTNGVVKSTSHLRGSDENGLQTVRIRFTVEGTLDTVQRTLAAIQTSRPAMFVDNMTITAPGTIRADKAPVLGLDLEVMGYVRITDQ